MGLPGAGQGPQQGHPPGAHIHHAQGRQAPGPFGQGHLQEFPADPPVLGQVGGHQGAQVVVVPHLLDLQAVQEASQGIGQLQGRAGVQLALQGRLMVLHQPDQLEAAAQGRDPGGQVHGQVAGLEGRLALVQVPQGADLRRQDRLAAAHGDEGVGQGPGAAPGGGQHHGLGQGVGPQGRQGVEQALGQVVDEGPVGGDGEPAGALAPKQGWGGGGAHRSRASATSRAAGSPTCIHSPSSCSP
jgi:hypothetical protein